MTPSELSGLKQAQQIRWLYDHISDDQGMFAGPALLAPCPRVDELATRLQADEARAWGVNMLHSRADFATLARHLLTLRYLHTQDGQQYYLRYADSRCLTALWPVLTAPQQRTLLGPVHCWTYSDRQLQSQAIGFDQDRPADVADTACSPLRLSDEQLSGLLQRCWPDQLLYSVGEQHPDIGRELTPLQQHACAKRVCDWLISAQEERYPVQLEMLQRILWSKDAAHWDERTWEQSLQRNHEDILYHMSYRPPI